MKRAALMLAMTLLAPPLGRAAQESDAFAWLYDLDRARGLARAQHKPLLLVFRCAP